MERIELARTVDGFMRRLHAGIHEKAEARDSERVGPFGGMVLMAIEEFQPVALNKLVEHMRRDKAQISRVLQQLGGKGLLTRAPSKLDGRSSLISLTPKGQCVVRDLQDIVGEVLENLLSPLAPDERQALLRLMETVQAHADEERV
ncbi:MAG: MarR family transcriptional regulator [Pseudomonadota bacterium]